MTILTQKDYIDKVHACWDGKNVGGTLGAPFECLRGVFELDGYTIKLDGEPLPNDDLDLQLVWLNAAEAHGSAVNSKILIVKPADKSLCGRFDFAGIYDYT